MTSPQPSRPEPLLRDARLQAYAFGPAPAWLWTADGARILWSNAAGAAAFGADSRAILIADPSAVSDARMAEVARLAAALPAHGASQLARLRAFSNDYGHAALFSCALIASNGSSATLIVAAEPPRSVLPLADRARGLLAGETGVAAFGPDGVLLYADAQAVARLGEGIRLEALDASNRNSATSFDPMTLHTYPADDAKVVTAWLAPQPDVPAMVIPARDSTTARSNHAQGADVRSILARLAERRHPLRFVWQTDADGRFTLLSDEFLALAGPRTRALLNQPWRDLASGLDLDPNGKISNAIASRATWSGIAAQWPVDGVDTRLSVTLSGIPTADRAQTFTGYRGFGLCHDVAQIAALAAAARAAPALQKNPAARPPKAAEREADVFASPGALREQVKRTRAEPLAEADLAAARPLFSVVPGVKNVVPFRTPSPTSAERRQALTPVERNAFQEIARALGARFANDTSAEFADAPRRRAAPDQDTELEAFALDAETDDAELIPEDFVQEISRALEEGAAAARRARSLKEGEQSTASDPNADDEPRPDADATPAASTAPATAHDTPQPVPERAVLDRLPVAALVYRANELIYANRAFHDWSGYGDLGALEQAGGFDRLFQAPAPLMATENGGSGRPLSLRMASGEACCVQAKLFSIQWKNDPALLFVFTKADTAKRQTERATPAETIDADANELISILDTATDGIVVMNGDGRLLSGNRSAQVLFGYDGSDLIGRSFLDLFAPESHREALAYLDGLRRNGVASVLNEGRDVIGRVRQKDTGGGFIPLFMTMGRINDAPAKFCAVFRDDTSKRRAGNELKNAERDAEKISAGRSDLFAKVAHELRNPLTAIIGFSEIMVEQRLGPIGSDRYREYASDIRTSGQRMVTLIDDLLDLARIEAGELDLTFERVDLNDIVRQCVAFMQPEAGRERVVLRVSLSSTLPQIVADAGATRQIVLHVLTDAIKRARAGGQVIVSTAVGKSESTMLRVRDAGASKAAMTNTLEPFQRLAQTHQHLAADAGLGLPLSKALAEANGAKLEIRNANGAGTLVEVAFPTPRSPGV